MNLFIRLKVTKMTNIPRNIAQDIKINYCAKEFEEIEGIFSSLDFHELNFLLALYGQKHNNLIDINKDDLSNNNHTFSRTNYNKSQSEFDTYFGFITIIQYYEESFEKVVHELAFEKTSINGKTFSKMHNVQLFYGYLIGGVEKMHKKLKEYGGSTSDIADSIHDFLFNDENDVYLLIEEILASHE